MENPAYLMDLVEQVVSLKVLGARRVLTALMPLIKIKRCVRGKDLEALKFVSEIRNFANFRTLRDTVILTLRKALFARSMETKQIGIQGVLHLLQIFKITSSLPVTQVSEASERNI